MRLHRHQWESQGIRAAFMVRVCIVCGEKSRVKVWYSRSWGLEDKKKEAK